MTLGLGLTLRFGRAAALDSAEIEMGQAVFEATGVAPSTFDVDLGDHGASAPCWAAFAVWATADVAANGVFEVSLEYTDRGGNVIFAGGGARSLSDPTAAFSAGPFLVLRAPNTPFLLRFSALVVDPGASSLNYAVQVLDFEP